MISAKQFVHLTKPWNETSEKEKVKIYNKLGIPKNRRGSKCKFLIGEESESEFSPNRRKRVGKIEEELLYFSSKDYIKGIQKIRWTEWRQGKCIEKATEGTYLRFGYYNFHPTSAGEKKYQWSAQTTYEDPIVNVCKLVDVAIKCGLIK